ncbi:hypothetical protein [Nocardia arthritidis]|uniref:Uncharacterized protein n=1 Tax=Nocardia arthritidis TaxID=228602 RepID=A0A6G9YA25_9NOCA|nr:hypothetical protein [Nocardia arthritidis]QIS10079.1 hypothetical protein F5544_10920 [Nocardia arthritidis]
MRTIIGPIGAAAGAVGLIAAAPAAHAVTYKATPTAITRIGNDRVDITVDYQCPGTWTNVFGMHAGVHASKDFSVSGSDDDRLDCDDARHTITVTIYAKWSSVPKGARVTVNAAFVRDVHGRRVTPGDSVNLQLK